MLAELNGCGLTAAACDWRAHLPAHVAHSAHALADVVIVRDVTYPHDVLCCSLAACAKLHDV